MAVIADEVFVARDHASRMGCAANFAGLGKVNALPVAALVVAGTIAALSRRIGRPGPACAIAAGGNASRGAFDIDADEAAIAASEGGLAPLVRAECAACACACIEVAVKARAAVGEGAAGLTGLCARGCVAACLLRDAHDIATDFREGAFMHGACEVDAGRVHQEGDAGLGLACIEGCGVAEPGEVGRGGGGLGFAVFGHGTQAKCGKSRPTARVRIATCGCKVGDEGDEGAFIEYRMCDDYGMALGRR